LKAVRQFAQSITTKAKDNKIKPSKTTHQIDKKQIIKNKTNGKRRKQQ